MIEKSENKAYDKYQKLNQYWLISHCKLLYIGCLIGAIVELVIMMVTFYINELSSEFSFYLLKYLLFPISFSMIISILGSCVARSQHLSFKQKQYFLSILTVGLTFVFSLVHNQFVVILLIQGLPILVTVIYEDEKLATIITILSLILVYISGCFVQFDPDKQLDNMYILNMLVLMVIIFMLWVISCTMIKFNEKKRKIVIQDDIERFDLQERIYIDGLTLIRNKSAFDKELEMIIDDNVSSYYLVMFDIDLFKQFNDSYGHLFGDRVLSYVGEVLLTELTGLESYRYGGDEFCLILKNKTESEVLETMRKIQKRLKRKKIMNQDTYITISIGIAKKTKEISKEEWIIRADNALYESKNNGRNQITFAKES